MTSWASSGLLWLGIVLFAGFMVRQYGIARYDQGFSSGSSQAVIACKAAADEAGTTATKNTLEVVKKVRTTTRNDDTEWLDARGLRYPD